MKHDNYLLTAESVTEGHPDKLCDAIADAVLDACLEQDPQARVACEVLATRGKILAAGEISATKLPHIPDLVQKTLEDVGYSCTPDVDVRIHKQSEDIASAVNGHSQLGAGDQGIVYGYACDETIQCLPLPVVLAHRMTLLLTSARKEGIIPDLKPDGKVQVTVAYEYGIPIRVACVVLSCQHAKDANLEELRQGVLDHVITPALVDFPADEETRILINPGGPFVAGGLEADTGLTGRKLMVDTYGGLAPHGGGALSGKDGTKVDRSGAYLARYLAKNIVEAGMASRCTVALAYAMGKAQPVALTVDCHGTGEFPDALLEAAIPLVVDLSPEGIIRRFGLNRPIFSGCCNYGHFTRADLPWEQLDCGELLADACEGLLCAQSYSS